MNDRICSRHFILSKPTSLCDQESPDWLPTSHLKVKPIHVHFSTKEATENRRDWKQGATLLQDKLLHCHSLWLRGDSVSETDSPLETDENALETQQAFGVATQTELTFTAMQEELDRCHQTIQSLTERLSMARFSEHSSKWQDCKIKYLYWLTKLQCAETSFDFIVKCIHACIMLWFNKADIFSGVYDRMVKLWLNCQDLAYGCGVSCSTISRIPLK